MDTEEWKQSGAANAEAAALKKVGGPDYDAFGTNLKRVLEYKHFKPIFL